MSKKHNTKHAERGTSNYPARLSARGLVKTPEMESLEDLQKRQLRRVHETCTVGDNHNGHECNGHPWWVFDASALSSLDDAAEALDIKRAVKLARGPEEDLLHAIFEGTDVA